MTMSVVVIGTGIVGVSTALWLVRDGHSVTLIDRSGPGAGASFGNGGVLACCSIVPVTVPGLIRKAPQMLMSPDQPLFLKWAYLPRMVPWLSRYLSHANERDVRRIAAALIPIVRDSLAEHQALAGGTRAERWIVPSDYLFIYESRPHFERDAFGWSVRRDAGFEWEELDGEDLHAYDPSFSRHLEFAVRLENHGRISDPAQYVKDLAIEAEAGGARILKADVEAVMHVDGAVTGVRASGQIIPCDSMVLATGAWSTPLGRQLGMRIPVESERGYHIDFWSPSVTPRSPVMIAGGKFVITPMEGRLRTAGTLEFGGLDAPPSREPFGLLERGLAAAIPGLSWSERTEWMGHRPAITDSIPVIGEIPGIKGAFAGFGHHHVGLTGGPKTGRLLAQMIAGRKPNIDLTPYSPARFTKRFG